MNYSPITIGIGAFVVFAVFFIGAHFAKVGVDKINQWIRAHPLQTALCVAGVIAVMVTVWVTQNQDLIECWPQYKVQCIFMIKPAP